MFLENIDRAGEPNDRTLGLLLHGPGVGDEAVFRAISRQIFMLVLQSNTPQRLAGLARNGTIQSAPYIRHFCKEQSTVIHDVLCNIFM